MITIPIIHIDINVDEMKKLLLKLNIIQNVLNS